jgi:very-short-patch-repair endonuclease
MDRKGRDARLALLAGRQAGAFTLAQAMRLGYPKATVYSRASSGSWKVRQPGVFVVAGSERTRMQDLWIAVLAVGTDALLSHESAALIHGAERLGLEPIVLTVRHGWHQRLSGLFVHQINDHQTWHETTWRGLPVSTPARSVVELGATQSEATIGRVADDLVRMRRTTFPQIAAVLSAVARPGKPGIERVARMLDARGDGYVPPASELERSLFDALAAGGLPAPQRQVRLPGRGPVRGIVDGAYRDARIVLEADGRRWHDRMAAARQDRERDAQVVRSGWVPIRWVYEQIVHHPDEVCAVVSDTRAVRLRDFGRAA